MRKWDNVFLQGPWKLRVQSNRNLMSWLWRNAKPSTWGKIIPHIRLVWDPAGWAAACLDVGVDKRLNTTHSSVPSLQLFEPLCYPCGNVDSRSDGGRLLSLSLALLRPYVKFCIWHWAPTSKGMWGNWRGAVKGDQDGQGLGAQDLQGESDSWAALVQQQG